MIKITWCVVPPLQVTIYSRLLWSSTSTLLTWMLSLEQSNHPNWRTCFTRANRATLNAPALQCGIHPPMQTNTDVGDTVLYTFLKFFFLIKMIFSVFMKISVECLSSKSFGILNVDIDSYQGFLFSVVFEWGHLWEDIQSVTWRLMDCMQTWTMVPKSPSITTK